MSNSPRVFRSRTDPRRTSRWRHLGWRGQLELIQSHNSWPFLRPAPRWVRGVYIPADWKEVLAAVLATAGFILLVWWPWR